MQNKLGVAGVVVAAIALLIGAVFSGLLSNSQPERNITTFEECLQVPGNRLMETWPVQCQYGGKIFSSPSPYVQP